MKNSKLIFVVAVVFLLSMAAFAQDEYPKIEVPVGFSFVNVHPNITQLTSFNVFGGGGGFVYNFSNWVGIKADFFGYTQGSGQKLIQDGQLLGNVSGNVFTYMFGPQIKKHSGKFQPFARGPVWRGAYQSRCKRLQVRGWMWLGQWEQQWFRHGVRRRIRHPDHQ